MDSCLYEARFISEKTLFLYLNAISGSLSAIGSSTIVFIILRGGRSKLCRLHNRLLLGISAIDVLYSIALGLSFIPSPHLDDCSYGKGNELTCTAQGFFLILGMAVPGYSAMLSIYYMATIVYSKTEDMLTRKFEPFMHAFAILPPLICAAIGAQKKYFFSQIGQCWIEDPCLSSKECDGWDGFGKGGWLVIAVVTWGFINTSTTLLCMITIYRTINTRAKAMKRYTAVATAPPSRMEISAKESAKQGLLYMSAFIFTYMWPLVSISVQSIPGSSFLKKTTYIFAAIFLPLQGFWNVLVYIRPRFVTIQRENEGLSFISIMKRIIYSREAPKRRSQRNRRSIGFDPVVRDCILANMDEIKNYDGDDDDDDTPVEI